jgi:hypothetical protein
MCLGVEIIDPRVETAHIATHGNVNAARVGSHRLVRKARDAPDEIQLPVIQITPERPPTECEPFDSLGQFARAALAFSMSFHQLPPDITRHHVSDTYSNRVIGSNKIQSGLAKQPT